MLHCRTYVDTIIKSGMPTPWRVPCLPCLALCPSPSVHFGGSRAEDRRLSYRGVWQCSPRPPVSRGERDDSNDGWEHGGRPRLTRGLYGWALRSRIIKGAQRALPCLALSCAPAPPPPQGLTGKEPRVLLVGFSPTTIPSSPPLLQLVPKAHTQRPKTRVLEKKGPLEEDGGTARWPACSTTFRNGKSRARAPGRRLLSPRPIFCFSFLTPVPPPTPEPSITPGCGAEKEGKEREGGRTLSCLDLRPPTVPRPPCMGGTYACDAGARRYTQYTRPPAGRPGCRRRSRLARSSEDARLPARLLSSPSV